MQILFLGDQWDTMWRRRQQLAWRLAKSELIDDVLYIERPLPVTSLLKFLVGRADRDGTNRWRRVLRNGSWAMRVERKLSVLTSFSPLPPIGPTPLFHASERCRDRWLVHRLQERTRMDRPVLWVSHPQLSAEIVQATKPGLLWYDCTEDFSAVPGQPPCVRRQIESSDRWLTERADVVTAVSRTLYTEKRQSNPNTYWLPNAVDTDLFLHSQEHLPLPLEFRGVPRPILSFVGGLSDWAHDWDLLDQAATRCPGWTFTLIGGMNVGPKTRRMLENHPNILCLGQKSYTELPAYLVHSDVCFQFYRRTRGNDTRNSQKLFLYLAAGRPIVSTPSADVRAYGDRVYLANSVDEFVQQVEQALSFDDEHGRRERQALARGNSWTVRVETVLSILQDVHSAL